MTRRNLWRSANLARLRAKLFELLGGRCYYCEDDEQLEVEHLDGCTWVQGKYNAETRAYRYLREFYAGGRLALACRSCNGSRNQSVHGTREQRRLELAALPEAPF